MYTNTGTQTITKEAWSKSLAALTG